jgi:hypothetical protein
VQDMARAADVCIELLQLWTTSAQSTGHGKPGADRVTPSPVDWVG